MACNKGYLYNPMELLTDKYSGQISGILSCYDRVLLLGTTPGICHCSGMSSHLYGQGIQIKDYPKYAQKLRDELCLGIKEIAQQEGISIEHLNSYRISKEAHIKKILDQRGTHPGLVHILTVMETCPCYKQYFNPTIGQLRLKASKTKCLHYYVYLIDADYGLCYLRIPTYLPCTLQFYFNGHNWLAAQLDKQGIGYKQLDNAFSEIDNWAEAQRISDSFEASHLHQTLDKYANWLWPVAQRHGQANHWSICQIEYATDISFKRQADLQAIYEGLISTAIHTVKPDNIATFLGKKELSARYKDEVGNRYNIRIEGTRLRHQMGKQSIKMYDKFHKILRIETTSSDIKFFKHYRKVEHKDGTSSYKMAAFKKNIYSLKPLAEVLRAANRRYGEFISAIEDRSPGQKRLKRVTQTVKQNKRSYRGLNFFKPEDDNLLRVIARGEFNIYGFTNKDLRKHLGKTSSQTSRLIKSLRLHGLIRKVRNSYKYYLTKLGKEVILAGQKLRELVIIPALNY